MHACNAGKQFVAFLWWSLVLPGRDANPQPTVWEADMLTTKPTQHGLKNIWFDTVIQVQTKYIAALLEYFPDFPKPGSYSKFLFLIMNEKVRAKVTDQW